MPVRDVSQAEVECAVSCPKMRQVSATNCRGGRSTFRVYGPLLSEGKPYTMAYLPSKPPISWSEDAPGIKDRAERPGSEHLKSWVRKTPTKKQHFSDGQGLHEIAPFDYGILRRRASASRTPQSVGIGRRRDALGDPRRFLRNAGSCRGDSISRLCRTLLFDALRIAAVG